MRISTNLQENFPFISVINHVNHEYVGIIINQDAQVTSIYDYSSIRTDLEKQKFLELGETWWWESNRQIPISIFLSKELALSRTREVIVAPTAIAKAIKAAAITTVVALTSPDSISRSREAENLVHKYSNCIFCIDIFSPL